MKRKGAGRGGPEKYNLQIEASHNMRRRHHNGTDWPTSTVSTGRDSDLYGATGNILDG